MPVSPTVDEVLALLVDQGARRYGGEAISQFDHALQCATLARSAGEPDAMVAAALLHDYGHLVWSAEPQAARALASDQDDRHEAIASARLAALFGPEVLEPIRLHVDAKRYLCAVEPAYFAGLSPASVRSLALQGGVMSDAQARAFETVPFALDAARLRRYDDLAKRPGAATGTLDDFGRVVRACAR